MVKQMTKQTKRPFQDEMARMKTNLEQRRAEVTGLAVTEQDVFMAVPSPSDFSFQVYRLDHSLQNPKLVVEKLRGCCGQMDIQSHDGKLWIPHNARHTVESRDRDGNEVSKFGKAGRADGFEDFGVSEFGQGAHGWEAGAAEREQVETLRRQPAEMLLRHRHA